MLGLEERGGSTATELTISGKRIVVVNSGRRCTSGTVACETVSRDHDLLTPHAEDLIPVEMPGQALRGPR